jgi:hypothetical protein
MAELLVGGRIVDFEKIDNKSVAKGIHRLKYRSDGRSEGKPLTIRFSADSNNFANPSEAQRLYIDDVKCLIQRRAK